MKYINTYIHFIMQIIFSSRFLVLRVTKGYFLIYMLCVVREDIEVIFTLNRKKRRTEKGEIFLI